MQNAVATTSATLAHTAVVVSIRPVRALAPPLSRRTVRGILKATGPGFVPSAVDIDIDKLGVALGNSLVWLRFVSMPSERRRISERRTALQKAKKKALALRKAVAATSPGPWRKEDTRLREGAELLLRDIEGQLRGLQSYGLPTSAFAWLVGAHLPAIYKEFFGREAGISRHRKKHTVKGPFLRFAKATLLALEVKTEKGQSYKDETIIRAFTTNTLLDRRAKVAAAAGGDSGSF